MNSTEDFWSHVSRASADECWPWLLSCDRAGRGRYRFEGKIRPVHHIVAFLEYGAWPRYSEIKPCMKLPSCCNPAHLQRHRVQRRRSFARAHIRVRQEISRSRPFAAYITNVRPDLHWLCALLGNQAANFLREHQGQTVNLQVTIPRRTEVIRDIRAITIWQAVAEAGPDDLINTIEGLMDQYRCSPEEVVASAKVGARLMTAAKESSDAQTR